MLRLELPGFVDYSLAGNARGSLMRIRPDNIEKLRNMPWVRDGLSHSEMASIIVMSSYEFGGTRNTLLEDGVHVTSHSVQLPLSGEMNVFFVSKEETTIEQFTQRVDIPMALEIIEGFLGAPWPNPNIIFYVVPAAFNADAIFTPAQVIQVGAQVPSVAYHELMHYYLRSGPQWLTEGGANFLSGYVQHIIDGLDLQSQQKRVGRNLSQSCGDYKATNIHDFYSHPKGGDGSFPLPCSYATGQQFLLAMYNNLGSEPLSNFLREVYWTYLRRTDTTFATGAKYLEREQRYYRVFLSHVPSDKHKLFNELYLKYHGAPIPKQ